MLGNFGVFSFLRSWKLTRFLTTRIIAISYKPVKNLRYNIHCFDVMLIFQNNAYYTYLHD